jgi:hypothetical protein
MNLRTTAALLRRRRQLQTGNAPGIPQDRWFEVYARTWPRPERARTLAMRRQLRIVER